MTFFFFFFFFFLSFFLTNKKQKTKNKKQKTKNKKKHKRVNTTIEYLPKCRFFWGFTSVAFDFDLLMSYGGFLDGLEEAGYVYMLTKKGFDGEVLPFSFLSFSFFILTSPYPLLLIYSQ